MSKYDEIRVKNFLQRSGLIPIRYNKEELRTLGKTPDFKVESEGKEVLFCEVKSIVGDDFEGVRDDPTYNNIQNKIHEAAKQFQSVNGSHIVPNVLAIVNHENGIDIIDLYSVLTGYFYTDKGGEYPLFMKYSQGRILNEKQEIDLYIWFQEDKNPYYCFNTDSMFSLMLYGLFNIQPAKQNFWNNLETAPQIIQQPMHCKGSVLTGYLISVLYHHYEAVQVRISEGKKEIDSLIIVTSKSHFGWADEIFVKAMKSMNR